MPIISGMASEVWNPSIGKRKKGEQMFIGICTKEIATKRLTTFPKSKSSRQNASKAIKKLHDVRSEELFKTKWTIQQINFQI